VFKRLMWWATGAAMGAGGSLWARRKVKRVVQAQVERVADTLKPANVASAAKGRVLHAVDQGRHAATAREVQLRDRLDDARTRRPRSRRSG
jgi:hypothetical protein